MIDTQRICMACMGALGETGKDCPHCGAPWGQWDNQAHQLPCGSVLAGKYLVGRALGQGGFGITYMGLELNLGFRVAVKEFYPQGVVTRDLSTHTAVQTLGEDKREWFFHSRDQFSQEARILARFAGQESIVNVRDLFLENGTAYIVMDYVEGQTLRDRALSRGGRLSTAETLALLKPVIDALAQVHEAGLLHRDISPDNIMLDSDGKAVLLDFGAARQISAYGEHSNTINVKHGYAPEEQYRTRGSQGPWTDVYAMCATIYRLVTGVMPPQAMDRAMGEDTLLPPTALGADMTPAQERALLRGLSVRASERTGDMGQLKAELFTQREAAPKGPPAKGTAPRREASAPPPKQERPAAREKGYGAEQKRRPKARTRRSMRKKRLGIITAICLAGAGLLALCIFALAPGLRETAGPVSVQASPAATARDGTPQPQYTPAPSPAASPAADGREPEGTEAFKAALVTDVGGVNDGSINQAVYRGMQELVQDGRMEYAHFSSLQDSSASYYAAVEQAVQWGADVVVCPGILLEDVVFAAQSRYPSVRFLLIDGQAHSGDYSTYTTAPNTCCVLFHEEQAGYLAGYAAVAEGYTQLAFLGGTDVPDISRSGYGFIQGADAAARAKGNADGVYMRYWYSGGYAPSDDILDRMRYWYARGTEVVFACGGGVVYSAISAAEESGDWVIGVNADQSGMSPSILTTAMKDYGAAAKRMLAMLMDNGGLWPGDCAGTTVTLGAREGCVGLPQGEAWRFASFTRDAYDRQLALLASGTVVVSPAIGTPPTTSIYVDYNK